MFNNEPIIYANRNDIPSDSVIVDTFKSSVKELWKIFHPAEGHSQEMCNEDDLKKFISQRNIQNVWVYFPWRNLSVSTVDSEHYFLLRTARNRDVITSKAQSNYRDMVVGIVGLSVGSTSLLSLVYTGGPRKIRLSDFDVVEVSNLNRMVASLPDVGTNKAVALARKAWEIDPFLDIEVWQERVTYESLKQYILSPELLNIFIDAMDSLDLKVFARLICREYRIPIIMSTTNGDRIILDVERYDLEPERPIFHGLLGNINSSDFEYENKKEWLDLAMKIVGYENLTKRMRSMLPRVGKDLAGVPQLSSSVMLGGTVVSYVVRKIANNEKMPSGRYILALEDIDSNFNLERIL